MYKNDDNDNLVKVENDGKGNTQEDLKKGGVKFDSGKARFDLIPPEALEEIAKIYTMGAEKYDDNNWRKGMKWGRVYSAVQRHLNAYWQGEDIDPESGLKHLAHAAWGCLTLINFANEERHQDFDDRWKNEED